MPPLVEVSTGARLHFGLFSITSGRARLGGIGMMVDQPEILLRLKRSLHDEIQAPQELRERIIDIVWRIRDALQPASVRRQTKPISVSVPVKAPVSIEVVRIMPSHRGFGSGTQLALAIAAGMERLLDVPPQSVDYTSLGRGGRSLVGTIGFHKGGFIIDPGTQTLPNLPPDIVHRPVPSDWRFVVIDPRGSSGPSGAKEMSGFGSLSPMPSHVCDRLTAIACEAIVPGLDNENFTLFASGVAEFNRVVGEHFAPVQGGIYAHRLIRELSQQLTGTEWSFVAQSSWGPAAVILCESSDSARALISNLRQRITKTNADLFITSARNQGAIIRDADDRRSENSP
jgi:beta-ribofuranosylaminobenzene 5'-phosphate synthase